MAATAPSVDSVRPADLDRDVALDADVEVGFSEALDEASLTADGAFVLRKQGSEAPVAARQLRRCV